KLGKVEKKVSAPLQQPPARSAPFRGELSIDFDDARELVQSPGPRHGLPIIPITVCLLQPLLGALPAKTKDRLEAAFQDRRIFSSAGATGMNIFLHLIMIPMLFTGFAVWFLNESFYSSEVRPWFLYGMIAAITEAVYRLRNSVISARPLSEVVYRGSVYGPLL